MPITINGSGTVTGISAGGLPDGCIVTADIVDNNITEAKIANGAVTQAKRSEQLTLGTAQASTSGTAIDFTGIPSWVKRVTVMFDGVSAGGTSLFRIRLGNSGGIEDTGYFSIQTAAVSTVSTATNTNGFSAAGGTAVRTYSGMMQIALLSSNTWVAMGTFNDNSGNNYFMSGTKTLSATLDRIRVTTVNGTDTFDAGTINIMYE